MQHFSFCINCAYAVFDSHLLTWMPSSKNLFHDSFEFLSSMPVEYSSIFYIYKDIGKYKIKKIYCNHSVVHGISDDGNIFSWGEDINKIGILGLGMIYNQSKPLLNKFFINKKITSISMSENHACAIDSTFFLKFS